MKPVKTNTKNAPAVLGAKTAEQKKWLEDWLANPVTKQRLQNNLDSLGPLASETYETTDAGTMIGDALKRLSTVKVVEPDTVKDSIKAAKRMRIPRSEWGSNGVYMPDEHAIWLNAIKRDLPAVRTHEFTHASNLDTLLSAYIQKFTDHKSRKGGWYDPNEEYQNSSEEFYPRIMELRYNYGIKPGQMLTESEVKQMRANQDPRAYTIFDTVKSDEALTKLLNTIASNKVQDDRSYT